ncbi:MAG: site-specific integrase [Defluviitaleaceae bacterium]|nr:site-specific integrase [Defluviitaleaceae bacterium]
MAIFKSKVATKDGRKWYFSVCYLTANGERKRKKGQLYTTKQEAQEAERQFLIHTSHNRIDMTLEEMYYKYISDTEGSIKGSSKYCKNGRVENHILPFFGKMNIHSITVQSVMTWKSELNQGTYGKGKKYSIRFKNNLLGELKVILKYGVYYCGLKENAAIKAKLFHDKSEAVTTDEEKVRYITPNEYNLFASVIDDIVFKVFFAFLYYMGVRKGEAQSLTWEDIFWETDQVRIIKTITNKTYELDKDGFQFKITNTKNRKNRTIKMPVVLKNMLLELYKHYNDYEGFNNKWFVFGGYRHLPGTTMDRRKDYYFDLVEKTYGKAINRITNHEFRHSHASYLISRGVKVERIAYRLGDTVEVVLKVYAHLFPEVEDEIIGELDLIENSYKIDESTKKEF